MPSTMATYIGEVTSRLNRYQVGIELDPGFLQMLVNRSRQDVQAAVLNVVPERFSRVSTPTGWSEETDMQKTVGGVVRRVYSVALPNDYMDDVVVRRIDGEEIYEARELSKRELYQVMGTTWNAPSARSPVYAIEKSPTSPTYTLYVSFGETAVTDSSVEVWYLALLPYMQVDSLNAGGDPSVSPVPDTEVPIGWDYEELVVLLAMVKVAQTSGFTQAAELVRAEIDQAVRMMELNYERSIDREKLELPSRESAVPNTPVPEVVRQ